MEDVKGFELFVTGLEFLAVMVGQDLETSWATLTSGESVA